MKQKENSNSFNNNDKEIDQFKNDKFNLDIEDDKKTMGEDQYVFGWSTYSELTNGRFAMIGFAAIILIDMISNKSFLDWAGLIH